MSLDITIKERKEFHCPNCGLLVMTQDVGAECSNGRVWYDFIESVGYYVPYEKRTEKKDWYGVDIEEMPTVDAVEVVRCRDCKFGMHFGDMEDEWIQCRNLHGNPLMPFEGFCSYGERTGRDDNA